MSMYTFNDGDDLLASQLNGNFGNTVDITTTSAQTIASSLTIGGVTTTAFTATGPAKFAGEEGHGDRTITSGSTYAVASGDFVVSVYKTVGSATTITLPSSPTYNRWLIISDLKGDAATNNITISGGTINGQSSFVLNNNYASLCLRYNTTSSTWTII